MRINEGTVDCVKDGIYCGNWRKYSSLCPYYQVGVCIEEASKRSEQAGFMVSYLDADFKEIAML